MLSRRREQIIRLQQEMKAQGYRIEASKKGAIAVIIGCGGLGFVVGILLGMHGVCP